MVRNLEFNTSYIFWSRFACVTAIYQRLMEFTCYGWYTMATPDQNYFQLFGFTCDCQFSSFTASRNTFGLRFLIPYEVIAAIQQAPLLCQPYAYEDFQSHIRYARNSLLTTKCEKFDDRLKYIPSVYVAGAAAQFPFGPNLAAIPALTTASAARNYYSDDELLVPAAGKFCFIAEHLTSYNLGGLLTSELKPSSYYLIVPTVAPANLRMIDILRNVTSKEEDAREREFSGVSFLV